MEYNLIAKEIRNLSSRVEAQEYIKNMNLKKVGLMELGKAANANITSKDNKERITDQIINATVGNRLRVEAIASIDLTRR